MQILSDRALAQVLDRTFGHDGVSQKAKTEHADNDGFRVIAEDQGQSGILFS